MPPSHGPPGKRHPPAADYVSLVRCSVDQEGEAEALSYPDVLADSQFCLLAPTAFLASPVLSESLMTGCVPVIAADDMVLPFEEKIDWPRVVIRIRESLLPQLDNLLSGIGASRVRRMRRYGASVFDRFLSSLPSVTLTTLDILNDRLIPSAVRRKEEELDQASCSFD